MIKDDIDTVTDYVVAKLHDPSVSFVFMILSYVVYCEGSSS